MTGVLPPELPVPREVVGVLGELDLVSPVLRPVRRNAAGGLTFSVTTGGVGGVTRRRGGTAAVAGGFQSVSVLIGEVEFASERCQGIVNVELMRGDGKGDTGNH